MFQKIFIFYFRNVSENFQEIFMIYFSFRFLVQFSGSKVESRKSKVESRKSKVESRKSKVESRKSLLAQIKPTESDSESNGEFTVQSRNASLWASIEV